MKAPRIPKFIREIYEPTPQQWLRWLRFKSKAIAIAAKGHDDFSDYYHACGKGCTNRTGYNFAGMHSSSSSTTLHLFPWARFCRSRSFEGTSFTVTCETYDSDLHTIAETDNY